MAPAVLDLFRPEQIRVAAFHSSGLALPAVKSVASERITGDQPKLSKLVSAAAIDDEIDCVPLLHLHVFDHGLSLRVVNVPGRQLA